MTALFDEPQTDMARTIARQAARQAALALPRAPVDHAKIRDELAAELKAEKAAALTRPKAEEPIFSAELDQAAERHYRRIGRANDQNDRGRKCRDGIIRRAERRAAKQEPAARPEQPTMNNVTQLPAVQAEAQDALNALMLHGDTSRFTPAQKIAYYNGFCSHLGLNALARPFEYIVLNGKERLYATRGCAEQLRQRHGISLEIVRREFVDGLFIVEVRATDKFGRVDSDMGIVSAAGLRGDALANAMLKATTKAKRRVTFSICSLNCLDETEVDAIRHAEVETRPTPKAIEPPQAEPPKPAAHPLYVNLPDGAREEFPRTKAGLRQALDFMETMVAPLVMNNLPLLDMAAEKFPDLAERIAELRAAAAQALTPPADDGPMWPEGGEQRIEEAFATAYDAETGEVLEPDTVAQKVAERRGAAPLDGMPEPGLSFPG